MPHHRHDLTASRHRSMNDPLCIGMIGLDTSHSVEFTTRLNHSDHPQHVPGGRVTVAFPTFSPDMAWSRDRVGVFTQEMRDKHSVTIVDSIEKVIAACDAVLLCSLDGRPHLEQARPVLEAGKRVFVDKPVAGTLRDAATLYRLAKETGTPMFSASAVRWYPSVIEVARADVGTVRSAFSYGPAPLEPTHPDLFFYGIHPAEALFTVLGPGCHAVRRVTTPHTSIVIGEWADGRLGTLHAMHRWPADYKVIKFGDERIVEQAVSGDYTPMLREIITFFQTGTAPVTPDQTLEIYAFMEAADESKRRIGARIDLAELP